ncbi:hypothetical protein NAEGRDRAFT_62278 [Naegleria gruberi]|uniref:COMM domain-containing protein 1 n=1 Tax=Naegleria gruberi TaxID=5762 RepID=D2V0F6_NAEGR|nr:uncharacterized protein NAEGRDRAFT_62278 [Naegleria gruberi]EFC49710.1 hypothetical protein NAEGRDRAFT_62278 [Naegleria gruberi]|eukprot:XP_002682454.1 hypothetical protein NAEGRDRAFT_62278 [Naegleria gruberi strain NEG-M]
MFSEQTGEQTDEAHTVNTPSENTAFTIDGKYLLALLKGLHQIMYEKDSDITESAVYQQVFGNEILTEEQSQFAKKCKQIIKLAGFKNWNSDALKEYLTNDEEAKSFISTPELVQSFVKFWSLNSLQIHQKLISDSKEEFGNTMIDMKWRIDQKTNINKLSEINESVAVVQISTRSDVNSTLLFEMDKDTVKSVMEQFKVIQSRIDQLS